MRKALILLTASVLVLAACGQGAEEAGEEAATDLSNIAIEADEYSFTEAPKQAQSGEVTITLANAGGEPHMAGLLKLNAGVEIGDLVAAAKEDSTGATVFTLGASSGGPNAVKASGSQVATVQLQEGNYAFYCLVPDAQGKAHLGLGMVSALEVTQADEVKEAPSADYNASANEYSFQLPERWDGTISLENTGQQAHELQILGVAEGKKPEDVEAFLKAAPGTTEGPPPFTEDGGGAPIGPGATETFDIALQAGSYYAVCFVPDQQEKAPHLALGMLQRFEVAVSASPPAEEE